MNVRRWIWFLLLVMLASSGARGGEIVVEDFDNLEGWQVRQPGRSRRAKGFKAGFARAETTAVGEGAIQITLPGMVFKKLWKRYPPLENIAWDKCAGVSFRVKGDGSNQYGCMALCGSSPTWGYAYIYFFSLRNTEWHTVTAAWSDFVAEGDRTPLGTPGSLPPSGISHIRFGDRWTIQHNNYPVPPHTYAVDHIALVETVVRGRAAPAIRKLSGVVRLLKYKKPVSILCMGDSITAGTSLKDREQTRYAVQLQRILRAWFRYEGITCVSRAVGGARMTNARAWINRDFDGLQPDLVTTLYGYNEKSGGQSVAFFKYSMNDYLDRIARKTGGRAAVLPMTTIPGLRHRFFMMDDYAQAVREVAGARGLTFFDLQKPMKALGRDGIEAYFADMAHPNEKGHLFMATQIATFLAKAAGLDVAALTLPPGLQPKK